ncbi:DUF3566 domain-containing protein [Demequina aestuarii]|uniref:DUF3566 domain-containing protein n=1 Tax=Demequina aestuarii TaxID=327095 RepID=UPI0009FCA826|nr:DUF3566 domain-containing protein [Demequina aestuarii]
MNADNRANPGTGPSSSAWSDEASGDAARTPTRSSLRPITSEQPVSGQQPRSPYESPAASPTSAQQPVSSQQPTSAQQPLSRQHSAGGVFSPVNGPGADAPATRAPSAPSSAPTTGQHPVSGQHPTSDAHATTTGHSSAFAGAAAGVGASASAGFGRFKDFAARAKEDLTSADDIAASERKGGPRKVRVLVSRIDPWSALKIGFLLSIALGIMMVVAVYVLWGALDSMGFFTLANGWVLDLFTEDQEVDLLQFFALNKWMSATVLMAVVNVVLLTALSTLSAFLYNTISKVVGGIYVTLTDD